MQRTEPARHLPSEPRSATREGQRVYPRRTAALATLALASAASLASCVTTPVTGRSAFNLVPVEQDKQLGAQAYADMLAGAPVADQHPAAAQVRKVVERLVAVAQSDVPVDFDWEVRLIDDPAMVNAWCLPGGKMAVYTGILPVTQNAAGLAVVMAHEIAHAVARHGTERMTQQLGLQTVLTYAAGDYAGIAGQVAALGVFLPWGRMQELEADEIGLVYMARAGYDPREAVEFWKRMDALGGGAPPEWLSTHPSHDRRIEDLQAQMPRALAEYEASGHAGP
ncbi:MAG TPA: M48 family metallopeptidase [Planctomycetota bacterium]|nr:M48 family metallopeptidase [Planctomycetota bacterium]